MPWLVFLFGLMIAPLGIVFSLCLIVGWPWWINGEFVLLGGLPWITIERFLVWMAIGLAVYFGYARQDVRMSGTRVPAAR